jgi:hypothetical protein
MQHRVRQTHVCVQAGGQACSGLAAAACRLTGWLGSAVPPAGLTVPTSRLQLGRAPQRAGTAAMGSPALHAPALCPVACATSAPHLHSPQPRRGDLQVAGASSGSVAGSTHDSWQAGRLKEPGCRCRWTWQCLLGSRLRHSHSLRTTGSSMITGPSTQHAARSTVRQPCTLAATSHLHAAPGCHALQVPGHPAGRHLLALQVRCLPLLEHVGVARNCHLLIAPPSAAHRLLRPRQPRSLAERWHLRRGAAAVEWTMVVAVRDAGQLIRGAGRASEWWRIAQVHVDIAVVMQPLCCSMPSGHHSAWLAAATCQHAMAAGWHHAACAQCPEPRTQCLVPSAQPACNPLCARAASHDAAVQ